MMSRSAALPWLAVGLASVGNLMLATVVSLLGIPLYFDSIGTMAVALHFGFAPGIATALVTHVLLAATGRVLFPFVCCSILTVLIVTLMKRRFLSGGYLGYLWMGVLAGIANGLGGSVLAYYLFSGVTEVHAIDRLVMGFLITGQEMLTAVFWAGMVTNLMDKLLSALVVFLIQTPVTRLIDYPASSGELVE